MNLLSFFLCESLEIQTEKKEETSIFGDYSFSLDFDTNKHYEEQEKTQQSNKSNHKNKKLIILIDALDQISNNDKALDLNWIPRKLPANILFVVSTTQSQTTQISRLTELGFNKISILPLTYAEKVKKKKEKDRKRKR